MMVLVYLAAHTGRSGLSKHTGNCLLFLSALSTEGGNFILSYGAFGSKETVCVVRDVLSETNKLLWAKRGVKVMKRRGKDGWRKNSLGFFPLYRGMVAWAGVYLRLYPRVVAQFQQKLGEQRGVIGLLKSSHHSQSVSWVGARTHAPRTHAHAHAHTHAHKHAHTHARIHEAGRHAGMHVSRQACTHSCTHARTHASTQQAGRHTHIHTGTHTNTYTHTHTHTHTHTTMDPNRQ